MTKKKKSNLPRITQWMNETSTDSLVWRQRDGRGKRWNQLEQQWSEMENLVDVAAAADVVVDAPSLHPSPLRPSALRPSALRPFPPGFSV